MKCMQCMHEVFVELVQHACHDELFDELFVELVECAHIHCMASNDDVIVQLLILRNTQKSLVTKKCFN